MAGGHIAAPAQVQITGNLGNGIVCAPPPAVVQITAGFLGFALNGSNSFGNGLKQIECPGIVVP